MSLFEEFSEEIQQFVKVTGKLAANRYVTGYGGNAAWRLEDDLILITPTMMNKRDITPADVVFIDMTGEVVAGQRHPVIARVEDNRVLLDPRTVMSRQEGALLVGLQNALKRHGK